MKIGHGPATVIGDCCNVTSDAESQEPAKPVEAGTLRERECGDKPRFFREAFLLLSFREN